MGLAQFIVAVTSLAAAQQAPSGSGVRAAEQTLAPLLSSAAAYVERFITAFGNVIGEERYVQDLLAGGRLMARRPTESPDISHRELRSDLVLVRTGDALGWQMFRDVFEADGAPVRDRQERLSRLFESPAPAALEQAARIARESVRYNIGAVERTLNTPVLTLLFLQAAQQPRFAFARATRTPGFSARVEVIDFREVARPTIIRTVQNGDRPASGRLWIDSKSGAVLQTELVLKGDGVSIRFTTLFRQNDEVTVAVPVRMQEEYILPSGKLIGTATYSGFRRFSVSTDTKVAAPGKAAQ